MKNDLQLEISDKYDKVVRLLARKLSSHVCKKETLQRYIIESEIIEAAKKETGFYN